MDFETGSTTVYTVHFHTGSGPYREEIVPAGRPVREPIAPDREGYDFTGWYRDEALTQEYVFTAPVNCNIRLVHGRDLCQPVQLQHEGCTKSSALCKVETALKHPEKKEHMFLFPDP